MQGRGHPATGRRRRKVPWPLPVALAPLCPAACLFHGPPLLWPPLPWPPFALPPARSRGPPLPWPQWPWGQRVWEPREGRCICGCRVDTQQRGHVVTLMVAWPPADRRCWLWSSDWGLGWGWTPPLCRAVGGPPDACSVQLRLPSVVWPLLCVAPSPCFNVQLRRVADHLGSLIAAPV